MLSLSELLAGRTISVYAPIETAPIASQGAEQINPTVSDSTHLLPLLSIDSAEYELTEYEEYGQFIACERGECTHAECQTVESTPLITAPYDVRASSALDWSDDDDDVLECHDLMLMNCDNQIDALN